MKHCRVSAFARVARIFALAAVALGVGAGSLLAQGSTGKIEGRVRDQAGAPDRQRPGVPRGHARSTR